MVLEGEGWWRRLSPLVEPHCCSPKSRGWRNQDLLWQNKSYKLLGDLFGGGWVCGNHASFGDLFHQPHESYWTHLVSFYVLENSLPQHPSTSGTSQWAIHLCGIYLVKDYLHEKDQPPRSHPQPHIPVLEPMERMLAIWKTSYHSLLPGMRGDEPIYHICSSSKGFRS